MIMRTWHGTAASRADADHYARHFEGDVLPHLRSLAGFRGARLLRRDVDGEVELQALTTWDSLAAVRAFAGEDYPVAIVEPEARAVLARFDDRVEHYEVVLNAEG
jgi:heme-degrading monooxygenase HmoA